jgi:multiple sugar transport system ATP-binding protein
MPAPVAADDGQEVVFGVRPEHFAITDGDGLPARVTVVEPTGAETLVIGRLGEQTIQVQFKERRHFEPGDEIRLKPLANCVHLFNAEGKRIN